MASHRHGANARHGNAGITRSRIEHITNNDGNETAALGQGDNGRASLFQRLCSPLPARSSRNARKEAEKRRRWLISELDQYKRAHKPHFYWQPPPWPACLRSIGRAALDRYPLEFNGPFFGLIGFSRWLVQINLMRSVIEDGAMNETDDPSPTSPGFSGPFSYTSTRTEHSSTGHTLRPRPPHFPLLSAGLGSEASRSMRFPYIDGILVPDRSGSTTNRSNPRTNGNSRRPSPSQRLASPEQSLPRYGGWSSSGHTYDLFEPAKLMLSIVERARRSARGRKIVEQLYRRSIETTEVGGCCSICLESWKKNETVCFLPCDRKHIHHKRCIEDWLRGSRERAPCPTCPICRWSPFPDEQTS